MSTVTFTKKVTAENRKAGEWLLGYYFRASPISKPPLTPLVTNFKGLITFLNSNYPTYIEYLGEQTTIFSQSDLIDAVEKSAKRGAADYRSVVNNINKELLNSSKWTTGKNLAVIGDTAKEIGNDIIDASKSWVTIVKWGAAIYVVSYIIMLSPGAKSAILNFFKTKVKSKA